MKHNSNCFPHFGEKESINSPVAMKGPQDLSFLVQPSVELLGVKSS